MKSKKLYLSGLRAHYFFTHRRQSRPVIYFYIAKIFVCTWTVVNMKFPTNRPCVPVISLEISVPWLTGCFFLIRGSLRSKPARPWVPAGLLFMTARNPQAARYEQGLLV